MIGKIIKELREEENLTQKKLAEILGIQNSTLCQYENNVRVPSDEIKISIAKYFNVSLDYLMTGKECDPDELRPLTKDRIYDACIKIGLDPNQLDKLNSDQLDLIMNLVKQIISKRNNSN